MRQAGRGNNFTHSAANTGCAGSNGRSPPTPAATPTPSLPVQIKEAGSVAEIGLLLDVKVTDDYAFVADSRSGLRVVDVSDPANPVPVGLFDPPGSTAGQGVFYAAPYVYLADGRGVRALDVSDPAEPMETGFVSPSGFSVKVRLSGPYAFAANREGGLSLIDVSDPADMQLVSSLFDKGSVHALDVFPAGSHVYVAMEGDGLRVVDVSDPASPNEISFVDTAGTAESIFVSGSYAYLADGESGLRVFDISDPASPKEAAHFDTPEYAQEIFLADHYAFVGDDSALLVLDVSDPRNPQLAGQYETTGYIFGIFVADNLAYLALGTDGLLILQLDFG